MHTPSPRLRQGGFTILEALVALLVMAFGILALAGMQVMLSRNAEFAKQRSEATRLAQERIERLRAYDGIGAGTIDWNNLPVAAETFNSDTNATFTVSAALGGATSDTMRPAAVTVQWTDRTNTAQQLVLNTVIARLEMQDIGFVTNPLPLNQPLRRVKDRNINIPIPAVDLGGGESASQFSPTVAVIYSNTTGNVVQWCTLPNIDYADFDAADVADALANSQCQEITGYVVAGYISRDGSAPSASAVPDSVFNALNINLSDVNRNTAGSYSITCRFTDAVDQNTGATIPHYKYYLCIVPLNAPYTWGGWIRVSSVPTSAGDYLICRYQYTQTSVSANERNIQPYVGVNQSIDEQNYRIVRSSSGTCPANMTVSGVSVGTPHQDCRAAQATATNCPASAYP